MGFITHATNLGELLTELNRLPEALVAYDRAIAIGAANTSPKQVSIVRSMAGRANVLRAMGRREEAEKELKHALRLSEDLGPKNPSLAEVLSVTAQTVLELGRPAEAVALAERALEIDQAVGSNAAPTRLTVLATTLRSAGRLPEAEQRAEAALKALESQPTMHSALFEVHLELATIKWALRRPRAQAEAAVQELSKVEGDTKEREERVTGWLKTHPA